MDMVAQAHFFEIRLRAIGALLLSFILLGLTYSFTTPLFEGPDETGHYQYVAYLVEGNGLPVQSFDRSTVIVAQGHQPPLYYALSAGLAFWIDTSNWSDIYRENPAFFLGIEPNLLFHTAAEGFPFRGVALVIHIARMLSTLFGAITVWGTYQLGNIVTRSRVIGLGAAALVVFNPQFLFISGVMNNDNPLVAFTTLALMVMASILIEGRTRRRAIWLGVWIGLALLSKLSGLVLGPLTVLTMVIVTIRERSWRAFGEMTLWVGLPVIVISGWWFVRNQILYGDPLGYRMFLATQGIFGPWDFSQIEGWRQFIEAIHQSFWGQFGWMKIKMKRPLYDLLAWPYLFAVVGALVGTAWRRQIGPHRHMTSKISWFFLATVVFVVIAWMVSFASVQGGSGLQGRYLFPAISAIAILIVGGISALVPDRWRWVPIGGLVGGLALLAVSTPSQYIVPKYRFFTLPESVLESVPHRLNGTFSPEIAIVGYEIQSQADVVDLTIYWQAQGTPPDNYKVFIHAINDTGQLCGQRDALPLDGAFLMAYWRAGDAIKDVHRVPIDSDCCTNGSCRLKVGLYLEDTGERLLYSVNGQPVSDHVEVEIEP